ncbi:MAG: CopG family antitoxin [Rubrobacteraceae bacterium]
MAKKLKEINSRDEIPSFENEEEEHEFWANHALSDEFWENAKPIPEGELPPPRPRKTPVSVRFDDDLINRLKTLAAKKSIGYQSLLRRFVAERLYEEEKREGMLK